MASVLDGMKTKEQGFPLHNPTEAVYLGEQEAPAPMGVVGHCPRCGSPIYGYGCLAANAVPVVRHSCDCRNVKRIEDTIHAK